MSIKQQGASKSQNRYKFICRTLLFVTHGSQVLLLKGAPDKKIWPNLYNGVGGHIDSGETVLKAVIREAREEVGLDKLHNLLLCGLISIETEFSDLGIQLFVFRASSPTLQTRSSNEGTAHWVNWRTIPAKQLVPDLSTILPRTLNHVGPHPYYAHYWYDDEHNLQIYFEETHDPESGGVP